jgi:hypothetical protein
MLAEQAEHPCTAQPRSARLFTRPLPFCCP